MALAPAATAPRRDTLTRAIVDDAIARGPGWVLGQLELEPVLAAGRRFLGFRLRRIGSEEGEVERCGIRVGDIVHAVNGIPLLRPEDMLRIGESMRSATVMRVQLRRDGVATVVEVPIVAH